MTRALTRILLLTSLMFISTAALAQNPNDVDCPPSGVTWTEENVQQCIDDATKDIERSPPQSEERAANLARRAELYVYLDSLRGSRATGVKGPEVDAALADYTAAIAVATKTEDYRYQRALLLNQMKRSAQALSDADALIAQRPESVTYRSLKGQVLASLERHREAIQVFTDAIPLAQSCTEGARLQKQINEFRHAFDPPPTREQIQKEIQEKSFQLYDMPDPQVKALGFPCTPSESNSFNDLVLHKRFLFLQRGHSYRAIGDLYAAQKDFQYALAISPLPDTGSVELCEVDLELRNDYAAGDTCRAPFASNSWGVLKDADLAAKIGTYLLEDGDLKGACRIAFPFLRDASMNGYLANPKIKALQKRVSAATKAASLTFCEKQPKV